MLTDWLEEGPPLLDHLGPERRALQPFNQELQKCNLRGTTQLNAMFYLRIF